MKVLIFAFSRQGYALMKKIEEKWKEPEIVCKVKCGSMADISESKSVRECLGEYFDNTDAIVFIGAAGIAVRSIAPFIKHKSVDPAVVVIDETGKFCISLLSGHMGGGNEIAAKIASMIGAVPVITTATDREGKFAVDDFARKNNMAVLNWDMAKKISAYILENKKVGIISDFDIEGKMPWELFMADENENSPVINISYRADEKGDNVLQIVPRIITAGIGCRKGVTEEEIEKAVKKCFSENNIRLEALSEIASIDIKKDEKGIRKFSDKMEADFVTYSAEDLKSVKGEFSRSEFVESVTGVSNVCERSAAARGGKLISHKKVYGRVTVALAEKKERYCFE